jgi:hypothetical protein
MRSRRRRGSKLIVTPGLPNCFYRGKIEWVFRQFEFTSSRNSVFGQELGLSEKWKAANREIAAVSAAGV